MDWVIVEVVIGLSFLFFVISIVASAINEAIAGVWKLRGRTLEKGIVNLLTGKPQRLADVTDQAAPASGSTTKALLRSFFDNSLIEGYRIGDKVKMPSYLSSRSFRNALFSTVDLLTATEPPGPDEDPLQLQARAQQVEDRIAQIPDEHLRRSLSTIWDSVNKDVTEFRNAAERWFDRAMERVSGWYKRRAQVMVFLIGLVVAVAVNADAIRTADHLWKHDGVREGLVAQLGTQDPNPAADQVLAQLDDLGFPIGWGGTNNPGDGWEVAAAVVGWLVTAIAVTFGAGFWFDFLGKVANLRAAGKKPESVLDKPS